MGNIVSMIEYMNHQRFQQVLADAQKRCASWMSFHKGFDIKVRHVEKRAAQQGGRDRILRLNLDSRALAAVILQGKLCFEECGIKEHVVKIVIDGAFRDFPIMDIENEHIYHESYLPVRVVVKDTGKYKQIIVTFYPLWDGNVPSDIPEVDYAIWS